MTVDSVCVFEVYVYLLDLQKRGTVASFELNQHFLGNVGNIAG